MLFQPYSWHVRHNSSDQLAAIAKVEILVGAVLTSLIQASAASILVVVVLVLVAEASYRVVEQPLRRRWAHRPEPQPGAVETRAATL